ncbi:MAG: PIG-L family deacetylase [Spartobacteria bacterium]|nr:PIG-L family deacetylase [Spartobacteria bacterium]
MKILALGAHPDDIEYGCGGALLQAVGKGHAVYLQVMTDGLGTVDRRSEQEASARMLGAADLIWGGFKDTELPTSREVITSIESTLRRVEPDIVFVNYFQDAHQDHKALASCTITACRYVKRVFFYHDYTSLNFMPDTFVEIGDELEQKSRLLACHASQVGKDYPTGLDLLESVHALAAFYGFMAKVKYAEAFLPLRNLVSF